jgi:hypothetical protein
MHLFVCTHAPDLKLPKLHSIYSLNLVYADYTLLICDFEGSITALYHNLVRI